MLLLWSDARILGLGHSPTQARLFGIPDGIPGAQQTMLYMRQLVREAVIDPQQHIRELALQIIPSSAWTDQIRAIQQWVQSHIRYVRDPPEQELVQTPQKTVEYRAGDCDDQSVLTCALLTAIGHPCRFVAFGFRGSDLSHVVSQTLIGEKWVTVETIERRPLGWEPPGITSRYVRKI